MAVMGVREITAEGTKRLKGSFGAAASLIFVTLVSYAGFSIAGQLVTAFFHTLLQNEGETVTYLAGILTTLFLSIALLSPFRLNVKRWFQGLEGEQYRSLKAAFSYFAGGRRYLSALWFTLVRYAAVFLTFLLPQLPSIVLATVIQVALEQNSEALGPIYGIFLVLLIVLTALALVFSLYAAMGFFLTDYLYVLGEERNPFKALSVSWRMMRGGRPRLLRLLLLLLPYYLLYLPLATIPFAAPNIRSALAVYAQELICTEKSGE